MTQRGGAVGGSPASVGSGVRVLIVDDDVRVAHNHRELVESLPGLTVVGVVHTGAEALEEVRRHRPDLLLLDLFLPDRTGLSVLEELRSPGWRREVGVVDAVIISALRDVDQVRTAMALGALHYLIKPFPLRQLRDLVERYASARKRMEAMSTVTQSDVDSLFGMLRPRASSRSMPKGLTATTAERVAEALRSAEGDVSAAELSESTGIARVTARRYLEHLCSEGRAELTLRYGQAGRPEHRYRWVP
ncbi:MULTISPECIES: response regulator [Actinomycetes]|uniref:response regulator n=1 Tax=Actinomycetes TaxID=1760 RepID=UPI0031D72162